MNLFFLLNLIVAAPDYYSKGNYIVNKNESIDYLLTYQGNNKNNEVNYLKFSTTYNPEYILNTILDNQTLCELDCNNNTACLGYTYFENNGKYACHTLSNLGEAAYTDINSYSYTKVSYFTHFNNHSLNGISYNTRGYINTPVYIDLNHNGVHDSFEPINYTHNTYYFEFNNLDPGMYLIRQIVNDDKCYELLPGILGNTEYVRTEIAYFNYVKYYYDNGHHLESGLKGGSVNDDITDISFDYILGNNSDTYLSFYTNYSIILGLTDESIINTSGDDIYIETYRHSSINAHVSVSTYNNKFTTIGILNDTYQSFDLGNYSLPVKYIKLHFFLPENATDSTIPRNIMNIRSGNNSYYNPSFAYYIPVPSSNMFFFYTDCSYYHTCYTMCAYHNNQSESCYTGCELFETTKNCDCRTISENATECDLGCTYALGQYVYPNYTIHKRAYGYYKDIIETVDTLDQGINSCENDIECRSVSLSTKSNIINTYYTTHYFRNESSYLLVKDNYHYLLSTSSSPPPVTTPTLTQTSTPTSTPTMTPTSTQSKGKTNHSILSLNTTHTALLLVILFVILVFISIYYIKKYKKKKQQLPLEHIPTSFNNPIYKDAPDFRESDSPIYQEGISEYDGDSAEVDAITDEEHGYINCA
jgi:hypothetical protein